MVTHQPCTKLQYAVENNDIKVKMLQSQVVFQMTFASPDVTVHEEYLIYDLVAVVSAIGGTMGLCIGISFRDVSIFFARYLRQAMQRMKTNKKITDFESTRLEELERQVARHEQLFSTLQNRLELKADRD